jgi:N-acetylmuramoyl-L-alanine amidase
LEAEAGGDGARARLVLSEPVRATVRDVPGAPGTVLRLYVDLPRGTRVAPEVRRAGAAVAPIVGMRVGAGERGAVRVVLELDGAATYHVERADGGRVIALAVAPAESTRAEASRAAPAPAGPAAPATPIAAARSLPVLLRPKIVVDPGHGGNDPGAQGFAVEKEVTLAVATRLAALLRERLDAEVVLTRTGDRTLTLSERTARANAEDPDIFVSIHANASTSRRLGGIETYYLNNTNDRATIRLATMENGGGAPPPVRGRTDLRYILSDLVQVGKMEESIALATAVQGGLVGRLRRRYADVVDLGVKQGPFYVLVGAHMPCALVETSFLTHPREGRRLAGRRYRDEVAEGIYAGIARFLEDSRRARTL